jgi:hypothetical protein
MKNTTKILKGMTREEAQVKLDYDYAFGKIDRDSWSEATDELSNPRLWCKEGLIITTKEE